MLLYYRAFLQRQPAAAFEVQLTVYAHACIRVRDIVRLCTRTACMCNSAIRYTRTHAKAAPHDAFAGSGSKRKRVRSRCSDMYPRASERPASKEEPALSRPFRAKRLKRGPQVQLYLAVGFVSD